MSKNFEQAYKELAQNEMPDLWDRIEAGLKDKSAPVGKTMQEGRNAGSMTEKENTLQKSIVRQNMAKQSAGEEEQKAEETKKEKTQPPVKSGTHPAIKILQRYSTLAAAAVCAAVVIPAVLLLGRNMGASNMAETGVDSAAAGAV
ncbi:MAG: hypothetical protein K2G19_12555, partial [Lachnospiraceae bacterium]|nr:hypothetical protein [Lachnospiraceae bacterium]